MVLNEDDRTHIDLQKMITSKGTGTAKHLSTALKKAKTDRDHNRSGTTRLRLEMSRAQTAAKGTKKKQSEIKKSGDQYFQTWTTPPQCLAAQYQADRAKPKDVYLQIRHVAVEEPETIEHGKMVRKLKMYREAIPDKPSEEVMKKFITNRLELLEKVKHKETYTKAYLLKVVNTILSPEDKEKVKAFLQSQEQSRSMSLLADSNRMYRLQQAYERSGREGLLSLNVKSKEFQNCFASTQNAYERAKSGFTSFTRGRSTFNRGNGRGRNTRQNNSNSGAISNSNQNKKNQNQNQSNNQNNNGSQNGFTKRTGRKRNRNQQNNSGSNSNSNNNNGGRNQGQQNNNNNGTSKSKVEKPEKVIPKYDTAKIPPGLSSWNDVSIDPKVRQLINKHFEQENITIQSPEGTLVTSLHN